MNLYHVKLNTVGANGRSPLQDGRTRQGDAGTKEKFLLWAIMPT